MSDIFREIDEELRRENLAKLWARYGRYVIIVVVAALVVAGGYVGWRNHQLAERQAQSTRYAGALALAGAGKEADAIRAFTSVAGESGGYAVLSAFEEAGLLAKAGKRKEAVAVYDRLAHSSALDPELRDLARLLSVMHAFSDLPPKTVISRLKDLTENGNPWRASALELTAVAQLKSGEQKQALHIYQGLADDLTAPQGLRARAAEMAAALAP